MTTIPSNKDVVLHFNQKDDKISPDVNIHINTEDKNDFEEKYEVKNDIYDVDSILDKIKKQFHTIDNNDVINIYIDDTNDNNIHLQSLSDHKEYEMKDFEVKNNDDNNQTNNNESTPDFLRSASIVRRKESLWTESLENEIKNFAKLCELEADKCGKKAKKNFYIGRFMQIALILLGSISAYSTASNFDTEIKNAVNLFSGFSTTVISSIYTLFGFTKKSTIAFETSLGMYSLSMMIKCELLKPTRIRKSPFELMHFCTMTHDKLMKKIGVEEF